MTGYYLGMPVTLTGDRHPSGNPGWVGGELQAPGAKKTVRCFFWADQIKAKPWGTTPLLKPGS